MKISGWKKRIFYSLLFFLGVMLAFFFIAPGQVEESNNKVLNRPPYFASEKAKELHKSLFIIDLHADSLLWNRNLLKSSSRGQVDIPRLIEGNVAIQAFTVVTKSPRKFNIEKNDDKTDNIFLLAFCQRWPLATWNSLTERALYQASKLDNFASASEGKLILIKSKKDLENYLLAREKNPTITAGFLGIEGAHALDGKIDNVEVLFNAGFRMMSPAHFFDNEIGGSAHGLKREGLTDLGKEMIRRMEAKNMIVDLAHSSSKVIDDVLAMATRPVVVSHTGVKGTCNNNRNLTDEQIKAIAQRGGVIGIGYWDTAVCGKDAKSVVKAIKYVVDLVGVDYVGLGSDFDGAVVVPFDTTGIVQITDALLTEGFTVEEIKKIMGENSLRVLKQCLPESKN
ncbi:MAG: dipeptidase [Blastocatellia bacterium]|nr:dipeptidase [Blastocatellia bacterium]MBN8723301.1 dipeptidase [Acidobacteriota bacterium]